MENYLKEMLVTLADAGVEFVTNGAKWFDIGGAKVRVASKELLIQIKNEIKPLRPKTL